MRKCIALALGAAICCSGCWSSLQTKAIPARSEKADTYRLGQPQDKQVGETMVSTSDLRIYSGFVGLQTISHRQLGVVYPGVVAGGQYLAQAQTSDGNFVVKPTANARPLVGGQPAYWDYCLITTPGGTLVGWSSCTGSFYQDWSDQPAEPVLKAADIFQEGSIWQEFIYNGKSKDTIRIQYREFVNHRARPAFYQDLTYDLQESRTIGFRGMTIDVLEATNSAIKFVVKTPMQ